MLMTKAKHVFKLVLMIQYPEYGLITQQEYAKKYAIGVYFIILLTQLVNAWINVQVGISLIIIPNHAWRDVQVQLLLITLDFKVIKNAKIYVMKDGLLRIVQDCVCLIAH